MATDPIGYLKGRLAGPVDYARGRARLTANRLLGREWIPNIREHLYLEPASVCNLACRFCAYPKMRFPRRVMDNALFADGVEQAAALGYRDFGLTPICGEVFADRGIFEKFEILEKHPGVESYHFFTNLTLPDADDLRRLFGLRKLSAFTVSVYGHDRDTFCALTGGSPKAYERLVANLAVLGERLGEGGPRVSIGLRTAPGVDLSRAGGSELAGALRDLAEGRGAPLYVADSYNNWGGLVSRKDVRGLGLEVRPARWIPKVGACALPFYKLIVRADGRVNACACRDAEATLAIGDLCRTPLAEILSRRNRRYMELIENQQRGRFEPVCAACDFYRSIYRHHPVYSSLKAPPMTLGEFFARLDEGR